MPEAWRGLDGETLARVSGVPDAVFAHPRASSAARPARRVRSAWPPWRWKSTQPRLLPEPPSRLRKTCGRAHPLMPASRNLTGNRPEQCKAGKHRSGITATVIIST
ncbi:hypothetical protein RAA17_12915 [Komagataeibacter rhaeticus]|nr:hypothetical protein [Komagataeibacter rhaeticus]